MRLYGHGLAFNFNFTKKHNLPIVKKEAHFYASFFIEIFLYFYFGISAFIPGPIELEKEIFLP
jgi:hypothetical protein